MWTEDQILLRFFFSQRYTVQIHSDRFIKHSNKRKRMSTPLKQFMQTSITKCMHYYIHSMRKEWELALYVYLEVIKRGQR